MAKKYHVEITNQAEDDAIDIWTHIAEGNPSRAKEFILSLEKHANTLETFPLRCPIIPESAYLGLEYHHLLYGDYRILYRVSGNIVYILRIIHSARLLDLGLLK